MKAAKAAVQPTPNTPCSNSPRLRACSKAESPGKTTRPAGWMSSMQARKSMGEKEPQSRPHTSSPLATATAGAAARAALLSTSIRAASPAAISGSVARLQRSGCAESGELLLWASVEGASGGIRRLERVAKAIVSEPMVKAREAHWPVGSHRTASWLVRCARTLALHRHITRLRLLPMKTLQRT